MNVKQDEAFFDLLEEPELGSDQIKQSKFCPRKLQTFKNEQGDFRGDTTATTTTTTTTTFINVFEDQTPEQFTCIDEIKEKTIECEMPKFENLQFFPKTIKQELDNTSYVKVSNISNIKIKQQVSGYIQPKTENEVNELLTSCYNLPNVDIYDRPEYIYLGYPCSSKPLKNTAKNSLTKSKSYECPICQNNFPSSQSRSTHIDDHFEKGYTVCQFCGKLMNKIEFVQHVFIHVVKNRTKHHIIDKSLKCNLSSKELKQKSIDNVDGKSYKCGTCFKIFNLKCYLLKHLIIHSRAKPFKCDICSKGFKRNYELHRHLIIHKDEKPFKCDICLRRFSRKSDCQKHLKIHSSEIPFKCDICSKGFTRKYDLKRHLIIHNGEKPLKCDICSKGFFDRSALKSHLIIHGGENPFKCDICFKGFSRKYSLQRHLINHNNEKSFKCDICLKGFNLKSDYQKHLIIHSGEIPFKCDICSKGFTRKYDFTRHLIIHNDEKPFNCDICSKGFSDRSTLKSHLIIHSGKNPFKCDICFKGFNQKSNLQQHLKKCRNR